MSLMTSLWKMPAAALLLAAPAAAAPPAGSATATPPTAAAVEVRIKVTPKVAPENARRTAEIFEMLHGGLQDADAELRAHLWEVACCLAEHGWSPPRVDVAMIEETRIAIRETPVVIEEAPRR